MLTMLPSQGELYKFNQIQTENEVFIEDEALQEGDGDLLSEETGPNNVLQMEENITPHKGITSQEIGVQQQIINTSESDTKKTSGEAEKRSRDSEISFSPAIAHKRQKFTAENVDNSEELEVLDEESTTVSGTTGNEVSLGFQAKATDESETLDVEENDEELIEDVTKEELPSVGTIVDETLSTNKVSNISESDPEKALDTKDKAAWCSLSAELLLVIFSSSVLDFQDLFHSILVCKQWKQNCDTELFWKTLDIRMWKYGVSWVKVSNFVDSEFKWKAIAKQRHLLTKECSLQEISSSIERKYAEMEKAIAARTTSDPLLRVSQIITSLQRDADKKHQIQHFEESATSLMSISSPQVLSASHQDLLYLINHTFFGDASSSISCKVISTHGEVIQIHLKGDDITNCSLSFSSSSLDERTAFAVTSGNISLSTTEIRSLQQAIGIKNLEESWLLFFFWRYCLSNDKVACSEEIAKVICNNLKWPIESVDIRHILMTSATSSDSNGQDEEEDIDIG